MKIKNIKLKYLENQEAADNLICELSNLPDESLFHIDVLGLAEKINLKKETALSIFIHGVKEGLFLMDWVYHCPTCGGVAHESLFMHEAASNNFCKACNKIFANTLDDNIEIFFSIHPNIKKLSTHLKDSYLKEIYDNVNSGNYLTWIKPNAIRGIDIIQNNSYRELMGSDVLSLDQSLQIMKSVILFTDIKGSTEMYEKLGDAKAFALVREHFQILFDTIKKFDGVPIKTIGDAVMGVFTSPYKAMAASIVIQQKLIERSKTKTEDEKIEVKIGLHTGAAIVVTLNEKLDYFGTTVNIAARIQSEAEPNEIAVSEELFNGTKIKSLIASVTKTVKRQTVKLKGISRECKVYHIKIE